MCYGCSGGGYSAPQAASYSPQSAQYSPLEEAVRYEPSVRMSAESGENSSFAQQREFAASASSSQGKSYSNLMNYAEGAYLSSPKSQQYFSPGAFLTSMPTEFISSEDSSQQSMLMSFVSEAFHASSGKSLPSDIKITVCSERQMKDLHEAHGGKWSPSVRGFSINRRGFGISEVFAAEDELARLMLTIGHEIGHVISLPMKDPVDEEAKAFAFSMAWMESIKDRNIGGLSEAISPSPAKNGLHNVAFDFVLRLIGNGRKALEVYLGLIKGEISINTSIC